MRLHPDTIEEVKQKVDIVDVISQYVVLKKRGQDFLGLCPFHTEKTPSFSVSQTKQMYYCFGCGEGGNIFKFLMEVGKQSFAEVVLDLAKTYQVPLKTLDPADKQTLQREISLKEQLYEILAVTASFYSHALYQSQGEMALNYLRKQRHLSDDTIAHFQLGYAPTGWETLYRYLIEQKRYPLALVAEAGLIRPRKTGNGHYDYFRDRLMIPILDPQGRVIGFGSRTLGTDEPKYLNSPDTPLFNKGKTLFALDKAKSEISKQDQAIVVEGYFDAIALHCHGFPHAVASLGTAFTQAQLRLLLRYSESKQVIFNFDADAAGTKATQRAIADIEPLVYSGQVQLRVLNLKEGKDADQFLNSTKDSAEHYHKQLENAPLWFDWQIQQLLNDKDLKQADQFSQVFQGMVKLLNHLEDSNQRIHYLSHCATILSQGNSQLIPLQLNSLQIQLKKPKVQQYPAKKAIANSNNSAHNPVIKERENLNTNETVLLQIYLHSPQYRQEIIEQLEEKELLFCLEHHRLLWQAIIRVQEEDKTPVDTLNNSLISRLQDRLLSESINLQPFNSFFHPDEKEIEDMTNPDLQIKQIILRLERIALDKYIRYCCQKLEGLDYSKDFDICQYYQQEVISAKQKQKRLGIP